MSNLSICGIVRFRTRWALNPFSVPAPPSMDGRASSASSLPGPQASSLNTATNNLDDPIRASETMVRPQLGAF
ncbi:hypothetical protein PaG_00347 [Moesziomyces aphidis]|uniref:Uncharacterized protein n=1 Tax=Moesziomyces aphidis TaxID=84754 RepID=W3VWY3_MOEAP|nr:hypothetical protein PaG_00347 [Moesziomyces aphidis]